MIELQDLVFLGQGLNRPECVLTHRSGLLFTADWTGTGGVSVVARDGRVGRILARGAARPIRPNGIALEPHGSFLIADLGTESGGIFRLQPDGSVEPVLTRVGTFDLPPTNFLHRDRMGRLWITVSTRKIPRHLAYRPDADDGFVVLLDRKGARIVADGLGYTNECVTSADGESLYVNETFGRILSRFPIRSDGSLGPKQVVARFGSGTYPDGLTLDAEGGLWVTSIVSNRILRLAPDGMLGIVIEDADPDHLKWTEDAFRAGELGRPHLDRIASRRLANISCLAFGGPDLATGYLGCLLGESIASFRSPIAGLPPTHWDYPLDGFAGILEALGGQGVNG